MTFRSSKLDTQCYLPDVLSGYQYPVYSISSIQTKVMKTKQKKTRRTLNGAYRPLPKGERGGIELLLIHSVEHVGKQGQVVEVRPGYAYNYLIPQGLATVATDHHKRMVDKHKAKLHQIEMARQAELRKQAAELAKQSITIEANATDDGHLYGSVGAADIVAALKNNDVHLSAEQIRLEGPLKELGLYTVKVRCSSEVEGELKVWVVPMVAAETP